VDKAEKQAVALVRERTSDGRIRCRQALMIAEETGLPSRRVGSLIDREGLKIIECQLGCFGWKKKSPERESS
jgi:hypothetical protein